jgi:hypothetical protein
MIRKMNQSTGVKVALTALLATALIVLAVLASSFSGAEQAAQFIVG